VEAAARPYPYQRPTGPDCAGPASFCPLSPWLNKEDKNDFSKTVMNLAILKIL
jgi:hypothetical protein